MTDTAILTGCNGQLGSYLCELLLSKGYKVVGLYRRGSTNKFQNLKDVINHPNLELVMGDITDQSCVTNLLNKYKPDEIYNTAAQSFVPTSFDEPAHTFQVDTIGVLYFLEAIKQLKLKTKFFHMSTSEMFGSCVSYIGDFNGLPIRYDTTDLKSIPKGTKLFQDESCPFCPRSPYGIAKVAAHHLIKMYRDSYGIFACANINFNFESPRRGQEFVTRKVTGHVAKLAKWKGNKGVFSRNHPLPLELATGVQFTKPTPEEGSYLKLGNLNASRDWSHAKDIARACWLTVQQDNPCDYVVSSMKSRTIKELCDTAFQLIGLDYHDYVKIDSKFYRPCEVDYLLGDSSRIRQKLGWQPEISFEEMIEEMVYYDIKANQ